MAEDPDKVTDLDDPKFSTLDFPPVHPDTTRGNKRVLDEPAPSPAAKKRKEWGAEELELLG